MQRKSFTDFKTNFAPIDFNKQKLYSNQYFYMYVYMYMYRYVYICICIYMYMYISRLDLLPFFKMLYSNQYFYVVTNSRRKAQNSAYNQWNWTEEHKAYVTNIASMCNNFMQKRIFIYFLNFLYKSPRVISKKLLSQNSQCVLYTKCGCQKLTFKIFIY